MTEIYLIRHAQAEGNSYRSMQGHWDGDVTPMGRRQIALLAERFRDVKVDALYSSDLYRTRLTAAAIQSSITIELSGQSSAPRQSCSSEATLLFPSHVRVER